MRACSLAFPLLSGHLTLPRIPDRFVRLDLGQDQAAGSLGVLEVEAIEEAPSEQGGRRPLYLWA